MPKRVCIIVDESELDTTQEYRCYYCERQVAFLPPKERFIEGGIIDKTKWRHVDTRLVSCETVATPSNIKLVD